MRKLLFAAAACLMVCGCTVGKSPVRAEAKLVITAKSKYQIVLPDLPPKTPILNHLNSNPVFSLTAFKALLDEVKGGAHSYAHHAAPVAPVVQQPVVQPEEQL